MTPVVTRQRYRCDFCTKRGTRLKMEFHERNCYKNPHRICSNCNNTGSVTTTEGADSFAYTRPCPYCAAYDPRKAAPYNYQDESPNHYQESHDPRRIRSQTKRP